MIDNSQEYILCAAIKRKIPKDCNPYHAGTNDICEIELGYRHHDIFQRFPDQLSESEQGFYTSRGRYVDRFEAMKIAYKAGQVSEKVAIRKQTGEKCEITAYDTDGNPIDWDAIESKSPYYMLFSEDLY